MNLKEYYEKHDDLNPWSVTKLKMAKCPFAANRYVEAGLSYDFKGAEEQIGKENLFAGICIHEMLENWHLAHLDKADFIPPGEILASHNIIESSDWMKLIHEFERAKEIFQYDMDANPMFIGGPIVDVEDVIEVDIDGNVCEKGQGYFKGTLDLTQYDADEQIGTITDYKRQWNVIPVSSLEENFQMRFYTYLFMCKHKDCQIVAFRLYFTRYGTFTEVRRTRDDVMADKEGFIAIAQGTNSILKKHVDTCRAIPGEHCQVCNYTLVCPVVDNLEGVINSHGEAVRMANLLHLRERQRSELSSAVRKFTAKHGDVSTGDTTFGYKSNKTPSWEVFDMQRLVSVIMNFDIDFRDLFKPDSAKINAFMNSEKYKADHGDDELYNELVKCVRQRQNTMFKARKS